MRAWTWLLPCWVWRWWFNASGKITVEVSGKQRDLVRIDDEFVLVRIPTARFQEPPRERERQRKLRKVEAKQERLRRKLDKLKRQRWEIASEAQDAS